MMLSFNVSDTKYKELVEKATQEGVSLQSVLRRLATIYIESPLNIKELKDATTRINKQ